MGELMIVARNERQSSKVQLFCPFLDLRFFFNECVDLAQSSQSIPPHKQNKKQI